MTELVPISTQLQRAPTLGNAVLEFVETELIGVTESHRSDVRRALERFIIYVSRRELSPKAIANYGMYMIEQGLNPNNVKTQIAFLKRFFMWCYRLRYTQERWYEYLPKVRGQAPPDPQIITQSEYEALLSFCLQEDQEWLITLGFNTGFRMGDCCMLRWEQVDREQMIISPLIRKTSKSTGKCASIPYSPGGELHERLTELWADRIEDEQYVSPRLAESYYSNKCSITQGMRRVFDRAGLQHKSFKHFRCTFESRLANSGMNIGLAAKITGRSDTRSLLRYIVPDMDAAREGVSKAMELHNTHKMFA